MIAASVYPLSFLVRNAVGEDATVVDLTKPGVEPHDAELSAEQVRTVSRADLVVYLGGHFQPVVERAVAGLGSRAFDVLPAARSVEAPEDHQGDASGKVGHSEEEDHAEEGESHLHDPHVWLDPVRMMKMNGEIAGRLAALHPSIAGEVAARAAATDSALSDLDESFTKGLKKCSRRELMTGHGAFGLLAERYGLEETGIGAGFAEQEPSPRRMAAMTLHARAKGIRTVFYERSTSAASARTIAGEVGARIALLDSIEGPPASGDYIAAMRRNLASLRKALDCR